MSESSLDARWAALRRDGRPGLVPYLTAGHPDRSTSLDALRMLEHEGADVIEVGIPFSDPVADGPVIQRANFQALESGMTVAGALRLVRDARLSVPVVAFSYLNPLLAYGFERFLRDARDAGVAGLLVTDLPAGVDPVLEDAVVASPLALIRLIAVTTSGDRLREAARHAQGFLYVISRLGVTGAATAIGTALQEAVRRVRAASPLPIAVGFGIGSAAQAREVARFADGIVVGSALVQHLEIGLPAARDLMRELREALDTVPVGGP